MILRDKLDLGFVRLASVEKDLEMKSVMRDSFSLVVPTSHPISKNRSHSVSQFSEESFIYFPLITAISIRSRLSEFVKTLDLLQKSSINQFMP